LSVIRRRNGLAMDRFLLEHIRLRDLNGLRTFPPTGFSRDEWLPHRMSPMIDCCRGELHAVELDTA
jgi:hypothetical protein